MSEELLTGIEIMASPCKLGLIFGIRRRTINVLLINRQWLPETTCLLVWNLLNYSYILQLCTKLDLALFSTIISCNGALICPHMHMQEMLRWVMLQLSHIGFIIIIITHLHEFTQKKKNRTIYSLHDAF